MRDFRVVQARAILKVTSVSPIRGFNPPAVIILGEKFQYAAEITYNGIEVSEFYIASPTRIIARIPDTQYGKALTELAVLAPVQLAREKALISLGISKPFKTVYGIDRLVQNWVMAFLTTPGSDIFNPSAGGGGRAIIGFPGNASGKTASAELSIAVDRTRQQILEQQASNLQIPAEERMLSCSLSEVSFDQKSTSLTAVVTLKNILGNSASVNIR